MQVWNPIRLRTRRKCDVGVVDLDSYFSLCTLRYLCINQMSGCTSKAPEEAGRIIEEMEQKYELGEIDDPPDPYHYTIQISTWSRSSRKESPAKVLDILSRMMQRSSKCQSSKIGYV